ENAKEKPLAKEELKVDSIQAEPAGLSSPGQTEQRGRGRRTSRRPAPHRPAEDQTQALPAAKAGTVGHGRAMPAGHTATGGNPAQAPVLPRSPSKVTFPGPPGELVVLRETGEFPTERVPTCQRLHCGCRLQVTSTS
ncbi:hypothetical protein E2I00_017060, partial [Balaenoptera physalus]